MGFGVELQDRASFSGMSCEKCKAPIYEHILNGEIFLLNVEPTRYLLDHDPETNKDFVYLGYEIHICEETNELPSCSPIKRLDRTHP